MWEPDQSLHPSRARSTQKQYRHFVLQLPWLCQSRGSELRDWDSGCLDCTCRITGSDPGVGWQHFVEAVLYFLCCSMAAALCQEDPCGDSWIPAGKLLSCFGGISRAVWELSRLPRARDPEPQPVRQHIAPCVITMVFTTLTPLHHVFIITTIILELESRSILCKSGMPGSANELVTSFSSKKTQALGVILAVHHRKCKCTGTMKS